MNFFQKTKLQQEISNLEKVYKKLNKKEKKLIKMKRRIIESETISSICIPAISNNNYGTVSTRNLNPII